MQSTERAPAQRAMDYLADLQSLLSSVDPASAVALGAALFDVWKADRTALFIGNGGSSSTVSHIVNDMQKNVALSAGRGLRALCLSDSTPVLMAWANDTEWENVFAPQVRCWAKPGDLLVAVSGSGASPNVIRAVEEARACGAKTFGLAGYDGGLLSRTTDACIVVESTNMQRIEDVHMVLLHIAFTELLAQAAEFANQQA